MQETEAPDAATVAEFLANDRLPEVRMKDERHARIASLAQTRDKLVKLRTVLKHKGTNLLAARGILIAKESRGTEQGLAAGRAAPVTALEAAELGLLVDEIRHLNASLAKRERGLQDQGPQLPGGENLRSSTGIGAGGASIWLSPVGDVQDFPDASKLAAYFGGVPRRHNSNATERSGHITQRGRPALVQCALLAARSSPSRQAYYRQRAAPRGPGKAISALARKFLGIIDQPRRHDWVLADFPRFVLADR